MEICTSCRISQLISSSKRSSVPKVIVFLLCRLNFTWNTAELTQLASAHHGIRILAFFQSFGSAANRNRANHTNLVPEREGSDEALILAYDLVRQCMEVPATSLDSLTEHAFCSVIYTMLVSRDGYRDAQLGLHSPAQPVHPRKKIR